jgi:hypothetical protein
MTVTYPKWSDRLVNFPNTAQRMCMEYELLFIKLLDQRDVLIKQREWSNQPFTKLSAFLPKKVISSFLAKSKYWISKGLGKG